VTRLATGSIRQKNVLFKKFEDLREARSSMSIGG